MTDTEVTALQRCASEQLGTGAFDARFIRNALLDLEKLPLNLRLDWPQTALLDPIRTTDVFDYEVIT